MKNKAVVATMTLLLGFSSGAAAGGFSGPLSTKGSAQSSTRFSSAYTTLTKCGSGMTRKEEREADARGQDIPTLCKGYGGYSVYISYSACASIFDLQKGEERITLGEQPVDWKQRTVEWRLANGKPFAVVMRLFEYSGDDPCATDSRVVGESLIVKGLKGFDFISDSIPVKGTPNPTEKARHLADQAYQDHR
jgi:hypothetical protein